MQNDPAQVNQFGGTPTNQLGTYPIPPSILAEDQQTKLQSQSQTPTEQPVFSQVTQTPLPQPEQVNLHSPEPIHIAPLYQPEPQLNRQVPQDSGTEPIKIKNSPPPLKFNQPKTPVSLTPPVGSPEEADHYMNTLIKLIDHDKIEVAHTDLKQFDPSTLQDHYRILFQDYEIEVSHGKAADSDKEFYILLFNQLDNVEGICVNKNILAYIHLTPAQFGLFKNSADGYLNKKKIAQEHEKFVKSLAPINDYLDTLTAQLPQEAPEVPEETVQPEEDTQSDQSTYDENGLDTAPNQQILDSPEEDQPQHNQAVYDPQSDQPDDNSQTTQQLDDNPPSDQAGETDENYNSPYLPN